MHDIAAVAAENASPPLHSRGEEEAKAGGGRLGAVDNTRTPVHTWRLFSTLRRSLPLFLLLIIITITPSLTLTLTLTLTHSLLSV